MHENYDDYDYDYEDDDSQDHFDDQYKHYFKFDPEAWDAWGKWLYDALNDIVESSENVWYAYGFPKGFVPMNGYFSNTEGGQYPPLYLGNNHYDEAIYKKLYAISDNINILYKNHIQQHSAHFLQQPNHYFGLYDILN